MFEFNTWVVNNLISGVKNGKFSREWAAVQLANYYLKGKITEADIERLEEETYVPEPEPVGDVIPEFDDAEILRYIRVSLPNFGVNPGCTGFK